MIVFHPIENTPRRQLCHPLANGEASMLRRFLNLAKELINDAHHRRQLPPIYFCDIPVSNKKFKLDQEIR